MNDSFLGEAEDDSFMGGSVTAVQPPKSDSFLADDDSFVGGDDGVNADVDDTPPVTSPVAPAPEVAGAPAPVTPQEPEPHGQIIPPTKPPETSVGSVIEDAWQFFKNVPKSVGKNLYDIGKGVAQAQLSGYVTEPIKLYKEITKKGSFAKDLKLKDFGTAIKEQGDMVGDSLVEKYSNEFIRRRDKALPNQMEGHGQWLPDPDRPGRFKKDESSVAGAVGRAAFHDPAGVALDVFAVRDLLTGAAKVAGRGVAASGKLDVVKALGVRPGRLRVIGRGIEKVADTAENGITRSIKSKYTELANRLGHDPEASKIALTYKGQEAAKGKHFAGQDETKYIPSVDALDPNMSIGARIKGKLPFMNEAVGPELQAVRDIMLMGESSPAFGEIVGLLKQQSTIDETLKHFGATKAPDSWNLAKDPKFARAARIKKAFDDVTAYYRDVREAGLKALGVTNDAKLKGRITQQYAVAKYGDTFPETLKKAAEEIKAMTIKPQYVPTLNEMKGLYSLDELLNPRGSVFAPMLEKFSGKNPFATDPRKYMRRVINDFRNLEGKMRWVERIEQDPRLGKAVTKGELKFVHESDRMATTDVLKKYHEKGEKPRARALFRRDLVEKHGEDAYGMMKKDPEIKKRLKEIAAIVPNKTVNRILKMEFTTLPTGFRNSLRMYDKLKRVFTVAATRLNPQYYTGNAIGDSIMLLIDGVLPKHMRMAEKFHAKGITPYQATKQAATHAENFVGKGGKAMDWINDVDAAGARAVITKHIHDKFKSTGLSQIEAEAAVERALPSLNKMMDLEIERGRLLRDGRKVKQVKELDRQIEALKGDAKLVQDGVEKAQGYFGNYLGMSPIQQHIFTRFHPFWAFNKTMWKLAVKMQVAYPGKSRLWKAFADHMEDENKKPSRYENYQKLNDSKFGDITGVQPFQGVKTAEMGDVDMPNLFSPLNNPLINAGYGMMGGKTPYSAPYSSDIPGKGGKTFEYDDKTAKKSVDQAGIGETAGRFIPVLPKIENVLFPEGVYKGKRMFQPDIMMTPQDKPLNPKTTLQNLVGMFGLKLVDKTVSEMSKEQKLEIKTFIDAAKKDIEKPQPLEDRRAKKAKLKAWLKERKIVSE